MDFTLKLKQEMKLSLTQEMKISMNILQMSSSNLKDFIEKEALKNPMLEVTYSTPSSKYNSDEETTSPFDFIIEEKTLIDFLEEQLGYLKISPKIKSICEYVINNLDDRGYLSISKLEIKKALKISTAQLKEAMDIIYTLEPAGIGAENLKESLKIQLITKDIIDEKLFTLIDDYLEELGDRKYSLISEKLHVSVEQIEDYLDIIKSLEPIPARGYFVGNKTNYVVPEAKIEIVDDELTVTLNEEAIPKIKINSSYKSTNSLSDKNNMYTAINLIKSIEKRYITLERVLNQLIVKQKNFFFRGKDFLQTLTLKDIAKELNLHESTISRAIRDKFIETPQGIIAIKSLFILNSECLEIKKTIEELIKSENKSSPLSDEKISLYFKNKGCSIARRTIAKYREELGIPSTRERKRK
ncbi:MULTISPECIES: RNA polymerase factor sigma-54 [Fusobacterium]|uniref:RNA polymerase factor sigma-54 n=1 Tax=Fusobacterium TaxID=848 RepID=UPI0008A4E593|nr:MULTISPECIES: RNA polymerase factor sigma-54 [Fusobacterium]MCF0170211.1 RNA polymerase factor sigma-54 [Fusobacterium varium]MCF2673017.1 RNA polymerase factor sigma-54 [Fusobacterium varium]MCI6032250.1 RNA polymerase factor sigma-54 [Fusobacterium varium]MDY4006775.1 RNA polymerase factor sigma-54 [Fusobacterium varium]OFL86417.1 RNA polymerase sigma-54 factor [Fusobacterium sp. HMSC073F01]